MSDLTVAELRAAPLSARSLLTDRRVALSGATVATGLIAGLYYAFGCAVMPGLRHASDRTFIEAMQHVNTSIQNPVFFASFMGAPGLIGWSWWLERRAGATETARLLRWALALYMAGFLTTGAINIPLNDDLDAAGPVSRIADPHAVREHFESTWVVWNAIRAVLSTAAVAVLCRALLRRRDAPQAARTAIPG